MFARLARCVFPGDNAGASLKPWRLPRPMARSAVFPGDNAGASLKLGGRGRALAARDIVFPGDNAGASLKPA